MARKTQRSHVSEIIENNPNLLELFEILHCGIALHTPDGIYHYANKAYRNMFGMAGNEPIGRHVRDYFDTAEQGVMLAIKTKKEVMGTTAAKDGVYGVAYRIPLLNAGGDLQGVLAEVVTAGYDRKNVAELMKLIQDLQKKTYYYEWETRNQPKELHSFERIVGESIPMRKLKAMGVRFATGRQPVLIFGESGTGKELIAEAVHINSSRAKKPFVKVNLGGISHTLFESEMFGHKKGAFTDATFDRMGRFELADKGTIFLDEIGDLDLSCQVKLLRVLQEQTFEVLGDSRPRKVDIRVVSATNADLSRMVREHTFREDLFYRINLITVHLPALRERREDIPLLVRYFADKQCEANGLPKVDFTVEAMEYLSRLPYPGNIRELKNLVERTLLVSGKQVLMSEDFKAQYQCPVEPKVTSNLQGMTLEEIERQTILQALEKYNNNMSQVATALGISRAALYRRLEKYNIMIND